MPLSAFVRTSMVLWIGVDDTDSLRGMCTTFLATELIRELTKEHDLIGYPRLVRLNPNVPWKTRGNGAVCVRIGRGVGEELTIGYIGDAPVVSHARAAGEDDPLAVRDAVARVVERWACFQDEGTNPGFAILRRPPPQHLYWKAVRDIVTKREALESARGLGFVKGYKSGRGIIGALAAASWRPHDRTYEILAYRHPPRWGTPRNIDPRSVVEMDQAFPSTFNNYDYANAHVVIAPHSPCPVQFGIRGDDPTVLPHAMEVIRGESPQRAVIFESNQGTDDHVIRTRARRAHTTIRTKGVITGVARNLPGGHAVFQLNGHDVIAYEPSKQFRGAVRALLCGDRVEVVAAVREVPRTLNLEKLYVLSLVNEVRKLSNPMCPSCGKRAKSKGRNGPFRCIRCGTRLPRALAEWQRIPRRLERGWYEPPAGSRRHLSMPLKRMGMGRLDPISSSKLPSGNETTVASSR